MKKVLLSVFVIGLFVLYGWHEKNEASEARVIPPSLPTTDNTSSQATPTTAASGQSDTTVATPTLTHAGGSTTASTGQYKNGTYVGSVEDAFYGNIQVSATITNGKLSDVRFLQYPNDRSTSIEINTQAMPYLKQEAIAAQSANVDIVSGATDSSIAFRKSLASALSQAH